MLESTIREKLKSKKVLLMTHIVIGYPTLDESFEIVRTMVDAGVDLMELQIPFSEPIADGPVILNANQVSLATGIRVADCLDFASRAASSFGIPFLFMSYYNIVHKFGAGHFADEMKRRGLAGAIVPDLPPEEGAEFFGPLAAAGLDPVMLFSPTTPDERLDLIASHARGFVYVVARKGVTGLSTDFSKDLDTYLARCRKATTLPLAVGFGIKEKKDVDFLAGKAEIAIIGTQSIRVYEEKGLAGLKEFLSSLR
jgi:tryptophan synthase alpha chain